MILRFDPNRPPARPSLDIYDVITARLRAFSTRDPLALQQLLGAVERCLDVAGIPRMRFDGREQAVRATKRRRTGKGGAR
jgi:hypothetical protein